MYSDWFVVSEIVFKFHKICICSYVLNEMYLILHSNYHKLHQSISLLKYSNKSFQIKVYFNTCVMLEYISKYF